MSNMPRRAKRTIGTGKIEVTYKCEDKTCKNEKKFCISQPGSLGTRITCLKCKKFLYMLRVR